MSYKRYWWALAIVIIGSFIVLGGEGRKMISGAPPLPDVYTNDGQLLFTGSSITDGQGVWQSIGGQEIGTVCSQSALQSGATYAPWPQTVPISWPPIDCQTPCPSVMVLPVKRSCPSAE